MKSNRKAQVFVTDMVFATLVFMIVLWLILTLWERSIFNIYRTSLREDMSWTATSTLEQLLRTPGDPWNWSIENVRTIGLAESEEMFGHRQTLERVIDGNKLINTMKLCQNNYFDLRERLLGSSRYNFWLEFACPPESKSLCFGGLYFRDYDNGDIYCDNGYRFHIVNHRTYDYYWVEAEEYWNEKLTDENCNTKCLVSENWSAQILTPTTKSLPILPGKYNIWVRSFDEDFNDYSYKINAEGIQSRLYGDHGKTIEGSFQWDKVLSNIEVPDDGTEFELEIIPSNNIYGAVIDAFLFTDDPNYDPNSAFPPLGNPLSTNIHRCIFGRVVNLSDESVTEVITKRKSAVFAGSSLENRILPKRVDVTLVLYHGSPPPVSITTTTTTTTTTLPLLFKEIECVCQAGGGGFTDFCPPLGEDRRAVKSFTKFEILTGSNDYKCGSPPNNNLSFEVNWTGYHDGDPNYFAFFIDKGLLGVCRTEDVDSGVTNYHMICRIPKIYYDFTAEEHNITLTGKNTPGFCRPDDSGVDAQTWLTYDFSTLGCTEERKHLGCSGSAVLTKCNELSNSVWGISEFATKGDWSQISAGNTYSFVINWTGWHGNDNPAIESINTTYWGLYAWDGISEPKFIGSCLSTNRSENGIDVNFYTMEGSFTALDTGLSGNYDVYLTAEDTVGVCPPNMTPDTMIKLGTYTFS